jgi:hypothetical protein
MWRSHRIAPGCLPEHFAPEIVQCCMMTAIRGTDLFSQNERASECESLGGWQWHSRVGAGFALDYLRLVILASFGFMSPARGMVFSASAFLKNLNFTDARMRPASGLARRQFFAKVSPSNLFRSRRKESTLSSHYGSGRCLWPTKESRSRGESMTGTQRKWCRGQYQSINRLAIRGLEHAS